MQALVFLATCVWASGQRSAYDGTVPMPRAAALLQDDNDASPFDFVPIEHIVPSAVAQADISFARHRHEPAKHHHRHHHHKHYKHHHHEKKKKHARQHFDHIDGVVAFSNKRLRSKHSHSDFAWPWTSSKAKAKAAKFGPEGCVETYKNGKGTCVIETRCTRVDIADFTFGFVCVLDDGDKVAHVFGKGGFDAEEKFDTLISCDKCLGPEQDKADPKPKSALGKVFALQDEVKDLTKSLEDISKSVNTLSTAVFGGGAPGPAPATFPAAAPASANATLVENAETIVKRLSEDEAKAKTKAKTEAKQSKGSFVEKAEALVERLSREAARRKQATSDDSKQDESVDGELAMGEEEDDVD